MTPPCARPRLTARDTDEIRRTAKEPRGVGAAGSVADPDHQPTLVGLRLRKFGRTRPRTAADRRPPTRTQPPSVLAVGRTGYHLPGA
ncbi:hypothetical protein ACHBTE_26460 [Streptomyces sp. M41]|uniref:hypothetical protein n=1 Tax=Streptomyces sp. M41 TaxID=3059412 RepID=UPI00374DB8A1